MAMDQLALLAQRAMSDPDFVERAWQDLAGTLAAEGIELNPDELEAVREFHAEVVGLIPDEERSRLTTRRMHGG